MINSVCEAMNIDELYGAKRMEVVIHVELPSFAYSRRLAKSWLINNFQY